MGGSGLGTCGLGERLSTGGNTGALVTSPVPNDRGGLCLVGENPGDEGGFLCRWGCMVGLEGE
jgi:hypothetical protein